MKLVVVSGLPAAGKSTLARRLAGDLGMVAFSKDYLKVPVDALADLVPDDQRGRLREASRLVFYRALISALALGQPAVADGNFNWSHDHDGMRALVSEHGIDTFEICLWGDVDTLRRRFAERADPPLNEALRPAFETAVARERVAVTTGECIEVDTTSFGALELAYPNLRDRVAAFVA